MNDSNAAVEAGTSRAATAARERIGRLRAAIAQRGLDAFYVRDVSNVAWLTAFEGVFDGEPAHAAFVDAQRSELHTDSRYSAAMRAAAAGGPWQVGDESGTHAKWLRGLVDVGTLLGIEQSMTLGEFRRLEAELRPKQAEDASLPELFETSGLIVGLRAVKDDRESACLQAAQAIADAAFAHIVGFMRPGMTEREVQVELEDYMLRHGADGLAFSSIVATGANGASPHAIPGATRLEAGQCVVMDFGARARGYCSDMTRMVFLGEPSARLRHAYATLRQANEQVEALLRPGVTGAQAQQLAEDVLAAGGFGGRMGHSLGHGVGIDVHEEPVLAARNDEALVVGNVVTVEPGIYVEGEFGMRLEDFGIVADEGFHVFTQSSHDMVII